MSTRTVSARTLLIAQALLAGGFAAHAHAYLGSFTPADGYQISQPWVDVSYFNAGQNGVNAGGGSYQHVAPDTGLWRVVGPAGGIYTSTAARNAALSAVVGNVYPATPPTAGGAPIYIVGDHSGGRTDNSALAFRNDVPLNSSGPAVYDYHMDTYDTGGTVPSSVTTGNVSYGIYFASSPPDAPSPGSHAADRFTQSIMDSSNTIGAQWGYTRDNEMTWRSSASAAWNYTGIYATGAYDRIDFNINLTNSTFELIYMSAASVTTILAPAGTPMGLTMNDLSRLRWQLEDGTNIGVGGKNFFDDATFTIPAPGTGALLGLGMMVVGRRRRA